MPVTDMQMAALRAFLIHDVDGVRRLAYQLGEEGIRGYVRLVEAALSIAARRRFAPRFTSGDLVRYVATARLARIADGDEFDFDPLVGEDVLRNSLGQKMTRTLEHEAWLKAVTALLDALTERELSTEADLDELLKEAGVLANQWQAEPSR